MREPTTRRAFLAMSAAAAAASAVAACRRPEPRPPEVAPEDAALARGVAWLQAQQGADGRFRSQTYGFFADGQSTTPFVALALLAAGASAERAVDACVELRDPADGSTGFAAAVPDYPVYATALTASLLRAVRPDAAGPSLAWLRSQQFRAADGWNSPAAGGFGMGSRFALTPPQAGHVDLSMTRRAVEALAGTDWDGADEARGFVAGCQSADGGFVYSPVQPGLNKGAGGPGAGYGSAICEGILAVIALGATAEDPVIVQALEMLRRIHRLDANPGLEGGPMHAFGPAMTFSYRAGAARVFRLLGGPDGWAGALTQSLLDEQRDDGSWANRSHLQKEDDPLIATAFALEALTAAS